MLLSSNPDMSLVCSATNRVAESNKQHAEFRLRHAASERGLWRRVFSGSTRVRLDFVANGMQQVETRITRLRISD